MTVEILAENISGRVHAPVSKSQAHRMLICAALADKSTVITIGDISEDIRSTIECLAALGAEVSCEDDRITVLPIKKRTDCPQLNCSDSGSTLRFLLPVAAAFGNARFTRSQMLSRRPVKELLNALSENGMKTEITPSEIGISGSLKSGEFLIPGDISSQYISGLLFALPLLDGESKIVLTSKLESSSYVEMTIDALSLFGVEVNKTDYGYFVRGGQQYISPGEVITEGDWSNSAVFLAMKLFGTNVEVDGLDMNSRQGDRDIINILAKFSAECKTDCDSDRSRLNSVNINISENPDLLPVLSVLCACAQGESLLYGASRLRIKESDRLCSSASLINSLGGRAEEKADALRIFGTGLSGGTVDSFSDHRIVMAAALAACASGERVVIREAQAVNKSYPSFFCELKKLGVKCNVI